MQKPHPDSTAHRNRTGTQTWKLGRKPQTANQQAGVVNPAVVQGLTFPSRTSPICREVRFLWSSPAVPAANCERSSSAYSTVFV